MDRLSIVRSVHHENGIHAPSAHWMQTGYFGPTLARNAAQKPSFGSVIARSIGSRQPPMPAYVTIPKSEAFGYQGSVYLGKSYNRFFQEITDTFQKYGRVVPVFNDKHISTVWEDAKWMYDRSIEMKVPFMAGSSLPVAFRSHPFELPLGSEIESAVGIGYSGLDIYGFHALETYQAFVERRENAERGVKWVRCLEGKAVWQAVDDGWVAADVMDAVYNIIPKSKTNIREDDSSW